MTNHAAGAQEPSELRCPRCASGDPLPIVYGYPGPDHIRAALRGEIALGGEVHAAPRPAFECRSDHCGHTFDPELPQSRAEHP